MDINKILTADALDLIFEGRYKEFGAYELRKSYNQRLKTALIVMIALTALLAGGAIWSNRAKDSKTEIIVQDVNLTDVNNQEKKAPPPPPPPKAAPAGPTEAEIALEKTKKKKAAEEALALKKAKEKAEREQAAKEKAAKEKAAKEKAAQEKAAKEKAAQEKARKEQLAQEEAAKAKAAQEKAEREQAEREKAAEEARQRAAEQALKERFRREQMARLSNLAGKEEDTGTAQKASGPSATYAGKVVAAVRPNIIFPGTVAGNPSAEVEVTTLPTGEILGRKLVRSSGDPDWDTAVLRAIDRTQRLPRDVDGRVPSPMIIAFRPKD